jgi:integrase
MRYRESLLRTVKRLAEGGVTSVSEFRPEKINQVLVGLSSLAPATRQNIRREALTLWRYAFEERMTDIPPLRVMRIKSAPSLPKAWPMHTLAKMLACAERDETYMSVRHRIRVCDVMPAWITIAYDSGLRFADVHSMRISQINDNTVTGVAHKTRKPYVRPLSEYAMQKAIELARLSPDGTLFSWCLTRRRAFLMIREFRERHGINGTFKYLRRSCATLMEAHQPGRARRYLQHGDEGTTLRHYIDESLLAVPEGPPPIR